MRLHKHEIARVMKGLKVIHMKVVSIFNETFEGEGREQGRKGRKGKRDGAEISHKEITVLGRWGGASGMPVRLTGLESMLSHLLFTSQCLNQNSLICKHTFTYLKLHETY